MSNLFHKLPYLKKACSILVLLVFALGITPKITLHKWFADHVDSTFKIPGGKTQELTKAGYNCKCDNLVAESHFVTFDDLIVLNIPLAYSVYSISIPPVVSLSLFHSSLRGPPIRFLIS